MRFSRTATALQMCAIAWAIVLVVGFGNFAWTRWLLWTAPPAGFGARASLLAVGSAVVTLTSLAGWTALLVGCTLLLGSGARAGKGMARAALALIGVELAMTLLLPIVPVAVGLDPRIATAQQALSAGNMALAQAARLFMLLAAMRALAPLSDRGRVATMICAVFTAAGVLAALASLLVASRPVEAGAALQLTWPALGLASGVAFIVAALRLAGGFRTAAAREEAMLAQSGANTLLAAAPAPTQVNLHRP
jgi:hypothetical protein